MSRPDTAMRAGCLACALAVEAVTGVGTASDAETAAAQGDSR
jgi:hypothetical protein